MIKLLHLADFHINAPFLKEEEMVRKGLKRELELAFEKLVGFAIKEDVDLLVLAGDLFDKPPKSTKLLAQMMRWMRELVNHNVAVCYISGNHDFGKVMDTPEGVYYAYDGETKVIELLAKDKTPYRLVMTGHEAKRVTENRLGKWPAKEDDILTIGVGHCAVSGIYANEREQGYMPVSIRELEGKHYDYIALGHIHQMQAVGDTGRIYYAGNGMGLDRTELGDKGGLLVSLDKNTISVKEVCAGGICRLEKSVDISQCESVEALMEGLKASAFKENDYLSLKLYGQTPIYEDIVNSVAHASWETFIANQLKVFHVKVDAKDVLPNIDIALLKEEDTVLGIGLKLMDDPATLDRFMNLPVLVDRYPNEALRREYIVGIMEHLPIEWVKGFITGQGEE